MKKFTVQALYAFIIVFFMFSFTIQARAQGSDGSAGGTVPPETPDSTTPTTDPVQPAGDGSTPADPAATPAPTSPTPTPTSTTPVKPKVNTPKPQTAPPAPIVMPMAIDNIPDTSPITTSSDDSKNVIIGALIAVGAVILFFFGLNFKKKKDLPAQTKEKKDDNKCLNIKKLLDEKLKEWRDLQGMLKNKAKEQAVKATEKVLEESEIGKIILKIKHTEEECQKLKKLFEECTMELGLHLPKTTLLYLYKPKENKILLAMKKRSFGKGKWNGVGGKLEEGESIVKGLIREAKEEIGVKIKEDDLKQVAILDFAFQDNKDWDQQTHVFFVEKWEGEPVETEEMIPDWHAVDMLPYDKMWSDDIHWLPLVLKGKKVNASFTFDKTGDKVIDKKVKEI